MCVKVIKLKKVFLFSFVFLIFLSVFGISSFAVTETSMNVLFEEQGSVIHYYGKYHVVQVTGVVTITNPTNTTYFGVRLPFKDTVLNYKQIMSAQDNQYIVDNQIFIVTVSAGQSISFNYAISGITNVNPIKNGSVMQSIIDVDNVMSFNDIRISLLKAPLEDVSGGGNPNKRIVTVRVENPTGVDIVINHISVIKTASINITNQISKWTFPLSKPNILVKAQGVWEDDIVDNNAYDGEVYWVDYEVDVYKVLFNFNARNLMELNITLIDQLNKTLNQTNETSNQQFLYILKEISSSVVQPGDIITVLLTILNTGATPTVANIMDTIPSGFEFYKTGSGSVFGNAFSDSRLIGAGETIQINYSLVYKGDGKIGLGFFEGAIVNANEKNVSSGKITFIKEYLPKQTLFVQKKVTHINDEDVKIEIIMKNIGQSVIKNIVLKEPLNVEDRFELISRSALDKGVWSVQEIAANEDFSVDYITGEKTQYNVLPNVFGIGEDEVYKTLITDTILKNIFKANKTNVIEIVGIATVIVFIGTMFFINIGWIDKLKSVFLIRKEKKVDNMISSNQEIINSLKEEINKK
jgi:hypothetical protein